MTLKSKLLSNSSGKFAIYMYDDTLPKEQHDGPFNDPLNHLPLVRFHSDLWAPAVVSITQYTVTLPAMWEGYTRDVVHVLGAHGVAGTPMIMGSLRNGTVWTPLNGSLTLPVYPMTGLASYRIDGVMANNQQQGLPGVRVITLGADTANIVLHEFSHLYRRTGAGTNTCPALTLTVEVVRFDVNLDAAAPGVGTDPVAVGFYPTLIKAGRGRFRSDRRYIRVGNASPNYTMALGRSIAFGPNITSSYGTGAIKKGVVDTGPVKFKWGPSESIDVVYSAPVQAVKI